MKRLLITLAAGLFAVTSAQADEPRMAVESRTMLGGLPTITIIKDTKTGKEFLVFQNSLGFQVVPMP